MGQDGIEQAAGCRAVIAAVVANIEIDGHGAQFGPGMHRQMRLREDHGAGDAGGFAIRRGEGMKQFADHRQSVTATGVGAEVRQHRAVEQMRCGAGAVVEVGNQVETVHANILRCST